MAVEMEKRIVITLQDIQGVAFQCQRCGAKLYVGKDFDALKFSISEPKVQRCPACGESWLESEKGQTPEQARQDRDHADKILDGLQHFRQRTSENIPWRILLELPGDLD